jgi:hypothetical protein
MKIHQRLFLLLSIAGLLLTGAALASCAPDTSAPERQDVVALAATADETSDTAASDTLTTDAETATVEFTDQACLDCHASQERVQELAVEEEQAESLSEGPG